MTARGFIIGMLVGGAVGAATALLFAPTEGTQTRQMLADKSRSAKDKVSQAAASVRQRVKHEPEAVVKQSM